MSFPIVNRSRANVPYIKATRTEAARGVSNVLRQTVAGMAILTLTLVLSLAGAAQVAVAGTSVDALSKVEAGSQAIVDHQALDELLKQYVVEGADGINRVKFAAFKANDHEALKSYIAAQEKIDPTKLDRPEHFAYFANLYNALTLKIVLGNYPVKSITDIKLTDASGRPSNGPWKAHLVKVNGTGVSLDDISAILRKSFMSQDPRGHYMLNCLSVGCPKLYNEAITGANHERLLTDAATAFARHPRGLSVAEGKAKSSSLYSWYQTDFGGADGVIRHLASAGGPEVAVKLGGIEKISSHSYDWALIDVQK
ncbi:MAG: DUF547 domain-containing protein [Filomicrobium sp.]